MTCQTLFFRFANAPRRKRCVLSSFSILFLIEPLLWARLVVDESRLRYVESATLPFSSRVSRLKGSTGLTKRRNCFIRRDATKFCHLYLEFDAPLAFAESQHEKRRFSFPIFVLNTIWIFYSAPFIFVSPSKPILRTFLRASPQTRNAFTTRRFPFPQFHV